MTEGAPDDTLVALLDDLDLEDEVNYPQQVLHNLLSNIGQSESPYAARYGTFIDDDEAALSQQLNQCLSPRVRQLFMNSHGLIKRYRVLSLGGDTTSHGPAIYLHLVQTSEDEWYWYIGQAYNLWNRINQQHRDFRFRRDNPSLHYYAHDRSINDKFVVLANLDDCTMPIASENLRLVLNLLEMWCCLLFRCLPRQTLKVWLRDEDLFDMSFDGPVRTLNVASPLDSGDELASIKAFDLLRDSDDEIARQYYAAVRAETLRPRASPRKRARRMPEAAVAPVSGGVLDRSDLVLGVFVGIVGTLTLTYWLRRG